MIEAVEWVTFDGRVPITQPLSGHLEMGGGVTRMASASR
jgi:hypothetical protein